MRAFIITSLCLALFTVLVRLGLLAYADYPRASNTTRASDAIIILTSLCWSAWAAWLLL